MAWMKRTAPPLALAAATMDHKRKERIFYYVLQFLQQRLALDHHHSHSSVRRRRHRSGLRLRLRKQQRLWLLQLTAENKPTRFSSMPGAIYGPRFFRSPVPFPLLAPLTQHSQDKKGQTHLSFYALRLLDQAIQPLQMVLYPPIRSTSYPPCQHI
jgi:hypothetical protein